MKSLVLVPIHPPYFHWAKQLLDSAGPEENIALGFSSQEEADQFTHPFPFITVIVDTAKFDHRCSFINNKKINLLKILQPDYEYMAVIDAESVFLRPTTPCLQEIWNNNCFVANHSIEGGAMVRRVGRLCGYKITDDLYPWFNQIPIYKSSLLPGFLEWFDTRSDELKNSWEAFDFILFSIYCRYELGMQWRILESKSVYHGLNEGSEWNKYPGLIHDVNWSTYYSGVEHNQNIKIIFHLDRYPMINS